jgi:hypothetical protein
LAQDRLLQSDQIGARLQSQLGDQNTASLAQAAQRVALASRLVLGEGQQRPPPLAQRRLGGAGLGLPQDVTVTTGPQRGVDANLLGVKAKFLQPAGLDAAASQLSRALNGRPLHNAKASPLTYAARRARRGP